MEKQQLPEGLSPFAWAIAFFCLPILLSPLAVLISPNLLENPALSDWQVMWFSIFFWAYPFVLVTIAVIAHKLHTTRPSAAKWLLRISTVIFYALLTIICKIGFA